MECKTCSSVNVQSLSLFWESLPAGSPLKKRYAPPAEVPGQLWQSLLAVAAGVAFLSSGMVLLGVLLAVAGLVWGAAGRAAGERYRGALSEWKAARLCLACTRQF
ncbi:hypothetical protein OG241_09555 [Streptomyces sp. NBC_01390]|uniref:hypothetical protein n=1 Tax=unclassified Streptomyces TaxID=2593676 RepID=UPI003247D6BF